MSFRVVRLGSERQPGEGLRIGTVRRPPRGVPKTEFSSGNWYDVWFPNLAPSLALMKKGRTAASEREWAIFAKQYRREMAQPMRKQDVQLLAALSHGTDFSIGCYCEQEHRCHRSVLKALLLEAGATFDDSQPIRSP